MEARARVAADRIDSFIASDGDDGDPEDYDE